MPGRSARQCRDRWTNYLAPTLSLDPWTPEEDALIIRKVAECGTKWAAIAKEIPRRSDNAIKNRWYTVLKRKLGKAAAQPQLAPAIAPAPEEKSLFEDGFGFLDKELADGPGFKEHGGKREGLTRVWLEWF
jgi:hypothetical protein